MPIASEVDFLADGVCLGSTEDIAASCLMLAVVAALAVLILYHLFVFTRKFIRNRQRAAALAEDQLNSTMVANPLAARDSASLGSALSDSDSSKSKEPSRDLRLQSTTSEFLTADERALNDMLSGGSGSDASSPKAKSQRSVRVDSAVIGRDAEASITQPPSVTYAQASTLELSSVSAPKQVPPPLPEEAILASNPPLPPPEAQLPSEFAPVPVPVPVAAAVPPPFVPPVEAGPPPFVPPVEAVPPPFFPPVESSVEGAGDSSPHAADQPLVVPASP